MSSRTPRSYKICRALWGVALACASGALASGIGYSRWYAALPHMTVSAAATLQLLVPVIAAVGGIALLGEVADVRLVASGAAILGGVALAIWAKPTAR